MIEEPKWLGEKRSEAMLKFEQMEMPGEREEEWRYTTLKDVNFESEESEVIMDGEAKDVIFTDLLSAVVEHPELVRKYISKAVGITDKFSAFHYANMANGVIIVVPDYGTAKLSAKITGSTHAIIITGKGSRLQYTEEYSGAGFSTDVAEIFAGEESTIDIFSVKSGNGKRFSFKGIRMGRNSSLNMTVASLGENFHRTRIDNVLEGEGAKSELLCSFSGKEGHKDFMVNSMHTVPNTTNNILAKGVLYGSATSVFRGKIDIGKDAQKTDSYMADHTLIMSEDAVSNSVPSLKIDANDVRASHGATVGQVDEEQLFYLESRGLSRENAEKLIVEGFFEPIASRIRNAELRETFRKAVIQ